MQAKKSRASRKSLFSSAKFSKTVISPEDGRAFSWGKLRSLRNDEWRSDFEHSGDREGRLLGFLLFEMKHEVFRGKCFQTNSTSSSALHPRAGVSLGRGRWIDHPNAFGADPQLYWCHTNSIPGTGKHWAELRTCPNSCCTAPSTALFYKIVQTYTCLPVRVPQLHQSLDNFLVSTSSLSTL